MKNLMDIDTSTAPIHPTTHPPKNLVYLQRSGGSHGFHQQRSQEHEEALLEECDAQLEAATHPEGPVATGEDGTEQEFLRGMIFVFRWLGWKDGPNSKWMKTSKKDWASQAKKLDEWNLEDLTRANAGVFFLCLPNLLTSPFRILLPISHHQPAAVYP